MGNLSLFPPPDDRQQSDLFSLDEATASVGTQPHIEEPEPPAPGCGRAGCISTPDATGTVCFFSDDALHAWCREQAKLKVRALAVDLSLLPADARVHRLERLNIKGWPTETVAWLARESARRITSRSNT